MNSYLISGAEKKTGADIRLELEAANETDARAAAVKEGILITECKQLNTAPTSAKSGDVYLREIALWLRFFGITTAVIVFAVVCKLIMTK
jgi:hypothetical protein